MSSPLPSPWVEIPGYTNGADLECDIRVAGQSLSGVTQFPILDGASLPSALGIVIEFDVQTAFNEAGTPTTVSIEGVTFEVIAGALNETAAPACTLGCNATGTWQIIDARYIPDGVGSCLFGPCHFSKTWKNYRLGQSYSIVVPDGATVPNYLQQRGYVQYCWFGDENTVITTTITPYAEGVDPIVVTTHPYSSVTAVGAIIEDSTITSGVWAPHNWINDILCQVRNLTFNGVLIDTSVISNLSNPALVYPGGQGGGLLSIRDEGNGFDVYYSANFGEPAAGYGITALIGTPFDFCYNLHVSRDGNLDPPADVHVLDNLVTLKTPTDLAGNPVPPYAPFIPQGYNVYRLFRNNWGVVPGTVAQKQLPYGGVIMGIDPTYVPADLPAFPEVTSTVDSGDGPPTVVTETVDLEVGFYEEPGGIGDGTFDISLSVAAELNCNRPDGNTPSVWSATTESLAITENSGTTDFDASSSGQSATRTLATNWRNMITSGNPDYGITNYAITKHNALYSASPAYTPQVYPEDIWYLNTYGFGRFDCVCDNPGVITLTANYTTLQAYDNHMTERAVTYTEDTGSASWTIPVVAGSNSVWFDLRFPSGALAPVDLGRIDSWTISGLPIGHTVVSFFGPAVKNGGAIKIGFGAPQSREGAFAGYSPPPDWSVVDIWMDGSNAFAGVPDTPYKTPETDLAGSVGGSIRYVDPMTGSESGVISDTQYAIDQFLGQIDNVEGISVVFPSAEWLAAYTGFGIPLAQCIEEILPRAALTAENEYTVTLSIALLCQQVNIVTGLDISLNAIKGRPYGGIVALCGDGTGNRAARTPVTAIRADGGPVVTAMTDADGVAVLTPLPADQVLGWSVAAE